MEAKTVGGYDVYVYPSEPDDVTIKGCIIFRGTRIWDTGEVRRVVEWYSDGKYVSTDRAGVKYRNEKFTDWDLEMDDKK